MKRKDPTKEEMRLSEEICMAAIDRCRIIINEASEANRNGARCLMETSIMAALLAEVIGGKPANSRGQALMDFIVGSHVQAIMDWGDLDNVSLTHCLAKDLMGQGFLEGGGWLGDVIKKARTPGDGKRHAAQGGARRRLRAG